MENIALDSQTIFSIARLGFEAVRAYKQQDGARYPDWDSATAESRHKADAIARFIINHPDCGAHAVHQAWVNYKISLGWLSGSEIDYQAKIHPNMVDFDLLPSWDQTLIEIFTFSVKSAVTVVAPYPVNVESAIAAPAFKGFNLLRATIHADPSYAWSWHCNICMPLVDGGIEHYIANKGTARVMQHIFGVDTLSTPEFKAIEAGYAKMQPPTFTLAKPPEATLTASLSDINDGFMVQGMTVAPEYKEEVEAFKKEQLRRLNERQPSKRGETRIFHAVDEAAFVPMPTVQEGTDKFIDTVTYTGDCSGPRVFAHAGVETCGFLFRDKTPLEKQPVAEFREDQL